MKLENTEYTALNLFRVTVLIVDDDKELLYSLRRILETEGFDVDIAESCEGATSKIERRERSYFC